MNHYQKIKLTHLNQNREVEVFEELTKEQTEKINGGRWCAFIIGGVEWGQTWVD